MSTHGAGAEGGAASEMGDKDDTGLLNNDESDEDGVGSSSQISRDTIVNPYWLEDKGLGRGAVDYLSGAEVSFWKDLIKQYLYPLDANKSQQVRLFDCKTLVLIIKLMNICILFLDNILFVILGQNCCRFEGAKKQGRLFLLHVQRTLRFDCIYVDITQRHAIHQLALWSQRKHYVH